MRGPQDADAVGRAVLEVEQQVHGQDRHRPRPPPVRIQAQRRQHVQGGVADEGDQPGSTVDHERAQPHQHVGPGVAGLVGAGAAVGLVQEPQGDELQAHEQHEDGDGEDNRVAQGLGVGQRGTSGVRN